MVENKKANLTRINLKKIDVFSVAKFQAIYLGLGGLFLSVISLILSPFIYSDISNKFGGFDILLALSYPLLLAIGGFLIGLIGTFFFNLILKINKGLNIDLQEVEVEEAEFKVKSFEKKR